MVRGYIIYEGKSLLDGSPIVAIVTLKSANAKTGNTVQTWILRQDMPPLEAVKSGNDVSICGGCKLRPFLNGGCYVNVGQAPSRVWEAYKSGVYPHMNPWEVTEVIAGRVVRLGSYGDPAAVPSHIWRALVNKAKGWVGYTHQWRNRESLHDLCMASVDTQEEYHEAKTKGWRTFRVRTADEPLADREIVCPAADEAGNKTTCEKCRLCAGTSKPAKDIAIIVHGVMAKRFIMSKKA